MISVDITYLPQKTDKMLMPREKKGDKYVISFDIIETRNKKNLLVCFPSFWYQFYMSALYTADINNFCNGIKTFWISLYVNH